MDKLQKAIKDLSTELSKAKYIKKLPDGKGGFKYIYKEGTKIQKKEKPKNQTETKEFKEWFDDSKVVDESGKPLIVYHTTNVKDIEDFKTEGEIETLGGKIKNKGAYFTPNKEEYKHKGKYQHAVYLNIKNPYITDNQIETAVITPEDYNKIIEKGFDGVLLKDKNNNIVEVIAFDNKQIKGVLF